LSLNHGPAAQLSPDPDQLPLAVALNHQREGVAEVEGSEHRERLLFGAGRLSVNGGQNVP